MTRISSGIDRSIDLTEHGDFRNGATPDLEGRKYPRGELPWDSSGRIKPRRDVREEDDEWIIPNGLNSFEPIVASAFDMVIPIEQYIPKPKGVDIVKADKETINEFRKTEDVDLLDRLYGNIDVGADGRIYYQGPFDGYMSSAGWCDDVDEFYTMNYSISVSSVPGWRTTLVNSTYANSSDNIWGYDVERDDITPYRFAGIELTTAERDGDVIMTGRGIELCLKIELADLCRRIRDGGYNMELKPTRNALLSYDLDRLWMDRPKYHRSTKLDGYETIKIDSHRFDTDRILESLTEGERVYRQSSYGDRGLHLIRRPRHSHELTVDLDTREFVEEDDLPTAQSGVRLRNGGEDFIEYPDLFSAVDDFIEDIISTSTIV